jgi:hypothetical protein
MSQYKDIPQPSDQRNVSQGDILTNYRYLSTPINVAAGVPPGIIPVDHQASGDNVANPSDGFHLQTSYINRTAPSSLVNAVNGQSSNGIAYSPTSTVGSQYRFYNGTRNYPLTTLYGVVKFSISGSTCTIVGNAYNVSSVTYNLVGQYTINFTQNLPNANYLPFICCDSTTPNTSSSPVGNSRTLMVGSFRVIVFDASTGSRVDPASVSVQVIEYF